MRLEYPTDPKRYLALTFLHAGKEIPISTPVTEPPGTGKKVNPKGASAAALRPLRFILEKFCEREICYDPCSCEMHLKRGERWRAIRTQQGLDKSEINRNVK
jgi:hypothetical protein